MSKRLSDTANIPGLSLIVFIMKESIEHLNPVIDSVQMNAASSNLMMKTELLRVSGR